MLIKLKHKVPLMALTGQSIQKGPITQIAIMPAYITCGGTCCNPTMKCRFT